MGVKNFFLKKYLKAKMKGVPEEQQEMILKMIEKNPKLFEKIGNEVKQKTKEGKNEMAATMEVMRKYQGEIQKLMQE